VAVRATGGRPDGDTFMPDGVANSNEAMEQIFTALGGFQPGGTGTLLVTSGQGAAQAQ
jgi:hypothetical protein